jgi:membrane-anchored protein YejM (alkaline phosphatase superfamily)
MGFFNPSNNAGVEVFAIGVTIIIIWEMAFFTWLWWTNRQWHKQQAKIGET